MTRDEAIINLKLSQNRIGGIKKEEWVALQMAIEALTYQNPSKPNNTCDVDLISRADAIELLTKIVFDEPPYLDSETLCRMYAEEQINALPSADAAEVVRCKECIHYESDGGAMMICNITDMVCDNDDYCSYGERREESEVEE